MENRLLREEMRFREMMGKDQPSLWSKTMILVKGIHKKPFQAYELLGYFCEKTGLIHKPDYENRIQKALGILDDWFATYNEPTRKDLHARLFFALSNNFE